MPSAHRPRRADVVARALAELLARRGGRAIAEVTATAVVAGAICWYFGADVWRSLVLGTAIAAAAVAGLEGLALGLSPDDDDSSWREERGMRRNGARGDVASLAASVRGRGGRASLARGPVHQIARRRLATRQLDIERPEDRAAIEQVVGRRAYRLLVRDHRRGLSERSLVHCLDALDALGPPAAGADARPNAPERAGADVSRLSHLTRRARER